MENFLEIPISENHIIHWKLNSEQKSDRLIIFIHGLWWNIEEHIFYNWRKFFNDCWFDTFRLDLYYDIKLTDNTITNHSKDLEHTINYFKDKYTEIYLVWHSIWWPIILLADTQYISKIVLRDPVLDTTKLLKWELHFNNDFCYVSRWMDIIIWEKMKNEILTIGDLNNKLDERYKIIYAQETELYNELWNTTIQNIIIPDSNHNFHNPWNEEKLFEETFNRIK